MTDNEKVDIFNQCTSKTYYKEEFAPILDDIYNIFDYEFNIFFGFGFKIQNTMKIEYIDRLFPFFKKIIDGNNIVLFKKIVNEVIHSTNNHISSTAMIHLIELLLYPQDYCNKKYEDSYFAMIIDYLVSEDKYDFYLENSNYLLFYYVAKLINHTKSNNFKKNSFGTIAIYYFLKHNIDPNKFIPILDYSIKNRLSLGEYIEQNFIESKREEFIDSMGNKVLNDMSYPRKSIK